MCIRDSITQVFRLPLNELRKKQVSGFYRDIPVHPSQSDSDSISNEIEFIDGLHPSNIDYDCTLLECHVDLDLPGFEETGADGEPTGIKVPYIVTLSEDSGQILSIRRNYEESDEKNEKYNILCTISFYRGLVFTD